MLNIKDPRDHGNGIWHLKFRRMALSLLWILLALLPRILLGLKSRLSQGLRADIACELPIVVVQLFNTKLRSFCKNMAIVIHQWQRMISTPLFLSILEEINCFPFWRKISIKQCQPTDKTCHKRLNFISITWGPVGKIIFLLLVWSLEYEFLN